MAAVNKEFVMDKQVEEKLEQFESVTRTDFPWVTALISGCGVVLCCRYYTSGLIRLQRSLNYGLQRLTLLGFPLFVHFGIQHIKV